MNRLAGWSLAILLSFVACGDATVTVPLSGSPSGIGFTLDESDAQALADLLPGVNRVWVRMRAGGFSRDTVVSAAWRDGRFMVRLPLHGTENADWIRVEAELRRNQLPLFEGGDLVPGFRLAPRSTISITPVPKKIMISPSELTFEDVGHAAFLDPEVVFYTGDRIKDLAVDWTSNDPTVVTVDWSPDDTRPRWAIACSEGSTSIRGSYHGVELTVPVTVTESVSDPPNMCR